MVLGFFGFGEVGFFMSKGLKQAGFGKIVAFDRASANGGAVAETMRSRANEAGIELKDSLPEMLREADAVISALPAKFAPAAAEEALQLAPDIEFYVDVTTAKPAEKKRLERLFADKKIKFVDCAMLGPLPVYGHSVPILSSGAGAQEWANTMNPFGMKIDVTEGDAGTASSIKLVRSVFMKGLEALLVESFLFARKSGAENVVLDSIAETLKVPFQQTAQRMIAADLVHAERRAFEVGESIELMKDLGVEPIMAEAIVKRLTKSAALGTREELGGVPPKTLSEVYEMWLRKQYN